MKFWKLAFARGMSSAFPAQIIDQALTARTFMLLVGWYLFPFIVMTSNIALSTSGRWVLVILVGAITGWLWSRINDTLIAAIAAFSLILTGTLPLSNVYATLGTDLIWLMVAAFMLASALRETGLVQISARLMLKRSSNFALLAHSLTFLIFLTAFIVPSTSARAALFLPLFQSISSLMNPRQTRAVALVIPTAILLTAAASLTGAGAHLAAAAFLHSLQQPTIGFVNWALLMTPGALISAHLATAIILKIFLANEDIRIAPQMDSRNKPVNRSRNAVIFGVLGLVLVGWMTEALHKLPASMIAWIGVLVLLLVLPRVFSLKSALKSVEWELILFLALTLALGQAITRTDLDEWCLTSLSGISGGTSQTGTLLVLPAIIAIALISHLVITSRTARVTVLVPALVLPAQALGVEPILTTLAIVMATGFCQTLPVSAKPVALYAALEPPPFSPSELLTLSAILAPIMAAMIAALSWFYWPKMSLILGIMR